MSWGEVINGWSNIYEGSAKTQKFFEDAAPKILKHGVAAATGSPEAGKVVALAVTTGSATNSSLKKGAGVLAYGVAVGVGTGILGLAATVLAPIWIPIAIFAGRNQD